MVHKQQAKINISLYGKQEGAMFSTRFVYILLFMVFYQWLHALCDVVCYHKNDAMINSRETRQKEQSVQVDAVRKGGKK